MRAAAFQRLGQTAGDEGAVQRRGREHCLRSQRDWRLGMHWHLSVSAGPHWHWHLKAFLWLSHNTRRHYVFRSSVRLSVCPSVVCPLTLISCDAISLYFVKEFQWNPPQIFVMWVTTAGRFSRPPNMAATNLRWSEVPLHCWDCWTVIHVWNSSEEFR